MGKKGIENKTRLCAQFRRTLFVNFCLVFSEHLISAFLPHHLRLSSLKAAAKKPEPYTIDELRISDPLKPEKSWTSTYHQITFSSPVAPSISFKWGPNMNVYLRLITMDVSVCFHQPLLNKKQFFFLTGATPLLLLHCIRNNCLYCFCSTYSEYLDCIHCPLYLPHSGSLAC